MIDNLIGAGAPSSIEFFDLNPSVKVKKNVNNSNKHDLIETIKITPRKIGIEITVTSTGEKLSFNINKILGQGGYGIVFELERIGEFADNEKNMVLKISLHDDDTSSNEEGKKTDTLHILDICKALYQGVVDVDFVIYKYLGGSTKKYIKTITNPKDTFKMFKQLYKQIYNLNIHNQFHNDVKMENTLFDNKKNEIHLIDYGLASNVSTLGTIFTICMYACVEHLSRKDFLISKGIKLNELEELKKNSKSTDIVGFFHFIIDTLLIEKRKNIYSNILQPLLELDATSSNDNYVKLLCLFCILSYNRKPYDILYKIKFFKEIIDKIQLKLYANIIKAEYIFGIKITRDYNGLILLYTYYICNQLEIYNNKKLFKFIYNLVINCFNSTFDLNYFNKNYDIMFNINFLKR